MLEQILKLFLISTLILSCQSSNKEAPNPVIDIEAPTKKLSLFGENVISTSLYERDIAISPNGNEIIYTLGDFKQSKRCLVRMKKQNGSWATPNILNFSGKYQDIEPFYNHSGTRLYFASDRPIYGEENRKDYNIWYSDKLNDKWSQPIPLDSIINTKENEFFPSLSKAGNLFFTATKKDGIGREDIFRSAFIDGKFQKPQVLSEQINSQAFEFNAYVSPDENLIVFSSFGRADGFGGGDLYFSQKDNFGKWKEAQNMGQLINSDKLDFCPFIDWRTRTFYFTSERSLANKGDEQLKTIEELLSLSNSVNNGFGNIYKISLDELNLLEK